jgi:hypothetical protein
MDDKVLSQIFSLPLRRVFESEYGMKFNDKGRTICPFCPQPSESLGIELIDDAWIWSCGKCGSAGQYLDFVAEYEGVGEEDAFARIKERHNLEIVIPASRQAPEVVKTLNPPPAIPEAKRETRSTLKESREPQKIEQEPERAKVEKTNPKGEEETIDDLFESPDIHRDIYMELLIERGCISFIGGGQKIGKSHLALNIGISLVKGDDFLGLKVPEPRKVLYLYQEIHKAGLRERLAKMTDINDSRIRECLFAHSPDRSLKLNKYEDREKILEIIERRKPDLVIFDPLCTFHSKNESDSGDMNRVMDIAYDIVRAYKIAILITHHVGKPNLVPRYGAHNLRGSSALGDRADAIMMLSKPNQLLANLKKAKACSRLLPLDCYISVDFFLRNDAAPDPFIIERNPETLWHTRSNIREQLVKNIIPEMINEYMANHEGPINQQDLVKNLEDGVASRRPIYEALKQMKKEGRLQSEELPGRGGPVILRRG